MCLSTYFHASTEYYLGKIFADFFDDSGSWKETTVGSFCEAVKVANKNIVLYSRFCVILLRIVICENKVVL